MSSNRGELTWKHVIVRVGLNAATHPIEYAKLLIQIGHEPLSPYKSRTVFGREKMFYPSVFTYIAHIKNRDGLGGCFRGLTPKLAANIFSGLAFQKSTENIKFKELDESDLDVSTLTNQQKTQRFIQNTARESVGKISAIVVSQPFHVIAVRCMAEFIGDDGMYTGIFSSVGVIYNENGITGFFSGLMPRILCEVGALWIGNLLVHVIDNYVIEDKELKTYVGASMRFLASAFVYPLSVVSNCMAVTGSGIAAGRPPLMPIHDNWIDCYKHLRSIKGLNRGSSLLWRAYKGPTILGKDGTAIPAPEMFKSPID